MSQKLVSDLMTESVHTVRPASNLAELADLFDR